MAFKQPDDKSRQAAPSSAAPPPSKPAAPPVEKPAKNVARPKGAPER